MHVVLYHVSIGITIDTENWRCKLPHHLSIIDYFGNQVTIDMILLFTLNPMCQKVSNPRDVME